MAVETLAPDTPSFDLGIVDTEVMGNYKEAEAFLSDTVIKAKSAEELEEVDEEEEEEAPAKKKAPIKKEPAKKSAVEVADAFLQEGNEEEEEEEEEETPPPVKKKEEDAPPASNQFEAFSKELYEINVLTQDEEGDPVLAKTGEELLGLFNKEKEKGAIAWIDNFLEQHGDDRRELFDAIFIKGADPKEYLPIYNQAQSLENIDLEQEMNQEKVMIEFYRRAGVAEDKIPAKIQRLKDSADLQTEAEEFHPQLVAQDKQKAAAIAQASEQKLKVQAEIEQLYATSIAKVLSEKAKGKDFEGIPISPKLVEEAKDFLWVKKWKTADGQLLTDFDKFILETKKPDAVEKRLKIAFLEKIGWDFSKIEKKAVSQKSGELFHSLAIKDNKQKQQKQNTPARSEW